MAYFDLMQNRKENEASGKIVPVTGIKDQEAFYREAKKLFDTGPDFAATARQYVVRLQSYDPTVSRHLAWLIHTSASLTIAMQYTSKLGVLLNDADICGESRYNDDAP